MRYGRRLMRKMLRALGTYIPRRARLQALGSKAF